MHKDPTTFHATKLNSGQNIQLFMRVKRIETGPHIYHCKYIPTEGQPDVYLLNYYRAFWTLTNSHFLFGNEVFQRFSFLKRSLNKAMLLLDNVNRKSSSLLMG